MSLLALLACAAPPTGPSDPAATDPVVATPTRPSSPPTDPVITPTEPVKVLAISLVDPVDFAPLAPGDAVTLHWPAGQGNGDLGYALAVTGSSGPGKFAIAPTVVRLDDGSDITSVDAVAYRQLIAAAEECTFSEADSAALISYGNFEDFSTLDGGTLRLDVTLTDLYSGEAASASVEVVGHVSLE
jgi:hypothetical protein